MPRQLVRNRLWRLRWVCAVVLGAVFATGCGESPTNPGSFGPLLICPAPVTVPSVNASSALVTYPLATSSGGTLPVSISCAPASGGLFPVGNSTVTCTGKDAAQRVGACTFAVSVTTTASPRLALTRFVAFGNSITEGKLASGETLVQGAYPAVLQSLLATRYASQTIVVMNEGCGGEKTAGGGDPCGKGSGGGVVRLPNVLNADHPDVLLLEEGVNDLSSGDPAAVAPMIEGLRTLVRQAQSRGVRVFVTTLLPEFAGGTPSRGGALPLIDTANVQIRQMVSVEGATLVDVFQGFGGVPGPFIDVDGLHPNALGYQKMAQIFFDVIRLNLETSQPAREPFEVVRAEPFRGLR